MCLVNNITVLILTHNEEDNIHRTLDKLTWAKKILVIDSGSTDHTLALLKRYKQVDVIHREFDSFSRQCNFGLSKISTTWVLSIDADYELSDELIKEIGHLEPIQGVSGYRAAFIYRVFGRSLRSTLYPPRTVLYRRNRALYRDEGHGHRVIIDGKVVDLKRCIYHDDRKSLTRWFVSQRNYAAKETDFLLSTPHDELKKTDRIRKMVWLAPILVFVYTLFIKRCLLDGRAGWYYVLQRTLAEIAISLEIIDRALRSKLCNGDNNM